MFDSAICGIYLLRDEFGHVVYVGQSVNCVARIGTHSADASKSFKSVTIIPRPEDELDDWEGFLIRALCPSQQGTEGPASKFWGGAIHIGPPPKSKNGRTLKAGYDVARDTVPVVLPQQAKAADDESGISPNKLYKSKEVSEILGISIPSIIAWSRTGRLPEPVIVGARSMRWRGEDIIQHMRSLQRGAA
jgi:predicted DNA-binding transcriptional regulator AlpA